MKRQGLGGSWTWCLGFIVLVMSLAACSPAAGHGRSAAAPAASRPHAQLAATTAWHRQTASAAGSVVLGGSPGTPAANPRTGTVYVPIQCATSFCSPNAPGHVVDVINAAK